MLLASCGLELISLMSLVGSHKMNPLDGRDEQLGRSTDRGWGCRCGAQLPSLADLRRSGRVWRMPATEGPGLVCDTQCHWTQPLWTRTNPGSRAPLAHVNTQAIGWSTCMPHAASALCTSRRPAASSFPFALTLRIAAFPSLDAFLAAFLMLDDRHCPFVCC